MQIVQRLSVRMGMAGVAMAFLAAPVGADGYRIEMESCVVDTVPLIYHYDLALDAAGCAHATWESNSLDRLYYSNNVGGQWAPPELIDNTSDYMQATNCVAVDSVGVAHVAYDSGYAPPAPYDRLAYATNEGGSWSHSNVRDDARWYSLDLNPDGLPRIAYHVWTSPGGLYLASMLPGPVWAHELVDGSGGATIWAGRYPDLAVDADDHGHIVYYNYGGGRDHVMYASNCTGSWELEEVVFQADQRDAKLALDPDDNVLLAYEKNDQIWLARREGNSWETVPVTDPGNWGNFDLATDPSGRIFVVYNDSSSDTVNLAWQQHASFVHEQIYSEQARGDGPFLQIHADTVHVLTSRASTDELIHLWGQLPPELGDLNCDGAVNAFDIDTFVLALTDPAGYAAAWPNCDRMLADCNGDGEVNAFDIDPFVALLIGP